MASDGKRYWSGVNGGGGGRQVGDAESGMSEASNQQAQEWVRKSRKRRQSAPSFEVRWDGLPPLAQLEFAREVVLTSTQTGVRRFGPGRSDLARLAELAPLHWHALGPNSGKAFLARFRKGERRQFAIRSDIKVHPERDGEDPSNGPCAHCQHMECRHDECRHDEQGLKVLRASLSASCCDGCLQEYTMSPRFSDRSRRAAQIRIFGAYLLLLLSKQLWPAPSRRRIGRVEAK